jgi:5-deoxy-glucuronate isomerase
MSTTTALPLNEATCVRRGTDKKKGRNIWLAPGEAAVRHLYYGRIILDAGDRPVEFDNGDQETGLICLRGEAEVAVGAEKFTLTPYDSLYIPRDSKIQVKAASAGCDLAEVAAPVTGKYPLQFIKYEDIRKDPTLHFRAGGPSTSRDLNILLGKNVKAGRICAGVTFSDPGHWTSWPPHEHTNMLEEAYLYINMPAPAWGVQFVYNNPQDPELVVVVREGDCVVMPSGYHPNVSAPGGSIGFLWMMAAHKELEDRQFGVVNVQPEYAAGGSGLEASRK